MPLPTIPPSSLPPAWGTYVPPKPGATSAKGKGTKPASSNHKASRTKDEAKPSSSNKPSSSKAKASSAKPSSSHKPSSSRASSSKSAPKWEPALRQDIKDTGGQINGAACVHLIHVHNCGHPVVGAPIGLVTGYQHAFELGGDHFCVEGRPCEIDIPRKVMHNTRCDRCKDVLECFRVTQKYTCAHIHDVTWSRGARHAVCDRGLTCSESSCQYIDTAIDVGGRCHNHCFWDHCVRLWERRSCGHRDLVQARLVSMLHIERLKTDSAPCQPFCRFGDEERFVDTPCADCAALPPPVPDGGWFQEGEDEFFDGGWGDDDGELRW